MSYGLSFARPRSARRSSPTLLNTLKRDEEFAQQVSKPPRRHLAAAPYVVHAAHQLARRAWLAKFLEERRVRTYKPRRRAGD